MNDTIFIRIPLKKQESNERSPWVTSPSGVWGVTRQTATEKNQKTGKQGFYKVVNSHFFA
ncbi:MAG: hypothetical protein CVV34_06130 [Methanomicrobiales archaeon HGW-Methanomicrobiales-5]|nr:MAG: hypothetical protein CVV34_06130 [Methanomicrobiales archaeon HGW-Methanomicrobiales-5]